MATTPSLHDPLKSPQKERKEADYVFFDAAAV